MITDNELSKIEREIVIQSLVDNPVNITCKAIDKTTSFAAFPVAINAVNLNVIDQGIIIIDEKVKGVISLINQRVRVEFYFNHLGLYFDSVIKNISNGTAIVIPSSILRIQKQIEKKNSELTAKISFLSQNNKKTEIQCYSDEKYSLFNIPSWSSVEEDILDNCDLVYNQILQDYSIMGLKSGDGFFAINASRYLNLPFNQLYEPIEDSFKPLDIIYIDDERIILATHNKNHPINLASDYSMTIYSSLASNSRIKRKINVNIIVEYEYNSAVNESCCFFCRYTAIKPEDTRYIYEKIAGKIMG